ncbi:DUF3243 domain-containing protein [Alkalihalobacillus deserti]|uniref:DUF3243 domain-containing protein n=1 Tax=Alkalihalobacillus deserti TaxID=2879466 RepID=UPI001D14E78C|nr:DUF3243 domain-containing protein [Alkalihalobacillus deserti]
MEHNTNDSRIGSKVKDRLSNMSSEKTEDILFNFQNFKAYLGKKVETADKLGLNEEQMARAAQKIGDYLASHVEPKNREEKLLYELWEAGNKDEQHMLSHMLVKLVHNEDK